MERETTNLIARLIRGSLHVAIGLRTGLRENVGDFAGAL